MTDQQLKIRIKLQQPQRSIEQQSPETTEPKEEEEEKPPFDWFKISLALLVVGCILGVLIYFLFGESESVSDQSSQEETKVFTESNISTDEDSALIPDNSFNFSDNKELINNNANPLVQQDTLNDSDHDIATESFKHPIPLPKPTILIEEETTTESPTQIDSNLQDQPQIIRAQLSHGIQNREPIDSIDHVQLDQNTNKAIYFFTQIRDLAGQRVKVDWYHKDKLITTTRLSIGADNWRTNASKLLTKNSLGVWRVVLTDQLGNQLAERIFTVSNGHEHHH